MTSVYDFSAQDITGREVPLADYRGTALLIVNTASKCGFTPQYEGLEALHRALAPRGFAVLGFPCDQFGHQEPGDAVEIASFCKLSYDVSFPLFSKIEVNGPAAHPLYRFLASEKRGLFGTRRIKWNFTKFLVDRKGEVAERFAPSARPEALRDRIERLL